MACAKVSNSSLLIFSDTDITDYCSISSVSLSIIGSVVITSLSCTVSEMLPFYGVHNCLQLLENSFSFDATIKVMLIAMCAF